MSTIGVLGAGSWGTALAVHLAGAGHPVRLWVRREEVARELQRNGCNQEYLPDVEFPEGISITSELSELCDADRHLMVVPSHGFRQVLRGFLAVVADRQEPLVLISGTKGIEIESLAGMSRVTFEEAVAGDREVRYAVLSGPSFAAELARGVPTAAVVASEEEELAAELREELSTSTLRLYSSSDVSGVELAGAAKNVIAIAAGVVSGLGLGQNTLAALITRGLHEMTRLGMACGGKQRTFSGLAGLGDLVLTCTGSASRNRSTGEQLAAGLTLEEIQAGTSMVAEGVRNARAIYELAAQRGVEMPIVEQMVRVLYEGLEPQQAIRELMRRELKAESEL